MILTVEELSKSWGKHRAVDRVSLSVGRGQVFGLLGPNGSGKTTTLGMILGVLRPDSGTIRWFKRNHSSRNRKKIGSLLEKPNFSPWLSGRDNLKVVADVKGVCSGPDEISRILRLSGLEKNGDKKFSGYSLGMKQRLAIAATLIGDPEVLVLDEPTNGIDASGISEIRELIRSLAGRGCTIILASHILDEVEKICSHVSIMSKGKILESGSIASVLSQGGQFEIAATNRNSLEEALCTCPFVSSFSASKKGFLVRLNKESRPEFLNTWLVEKGIQICYLADKHKSLESHFLALLEKET